MNRAHRQKRLKTTITTTKQQQSPGGVSKLEPPTVRTIRVPRRSRSGKNEAGTRGVHAAQRPDFQMARASLAQLGPLYRAMAVLPARAARIFTLIPDFCLLHIHTRAHTDPDSGEVSSSERSKKTRKNIKKSFFLRNSATTQKYQLVVAREAPDQSREREPLNPPQASPSKRGGGCNTWL